jgi:hypothetical protein
MSIRNTYPTIRPSLNLDFARSRTLDPRITFSRTTTGTYMDSDGLIKVASVDEARFDHRYVNGQLESLGLLVEESRSNLFTRSDIEGTVGTQPIGMNLAGTGSGQSAVVSTDYYVGTNEQSCKHTRGTSGDNNVGYFGASVSANINYAFSAWVYIPESQASNFSGKYIHFYMENTNNSVTRAEADTSIVGRWQRVFGVANVPANNAGGGTLTSQTWVCRTDAANGSFFYTDAWQLEAGSFSTSYINAEGGSSKTREPDNASMTGNNFSDWYNQDEGTIYVSQKLRAVQDAGRNNIVYMINTNGNGTDYFYNTNKGNQNIFVFGDGGTNYSRFGESSDSTDSTIAWAYDVSGDDFKAYYNGIEATNETSNNTPSATSHNQLELGATAGAKYNGHISKLSYYSRRLSNSQLQNLTK